MESPYIFERGSGLVHVRLRARPKDCIGDVRLDVYEIAYAAAYADGWKAGIEAALKVAERVGVGGAA